MVDQLNTLTTVLSEKLLQIADYQRPYAWEDKQLGDLWDDLDLLGTESHYAGTLVLQRTTEPTRQSSSGEDLGTYEVVDGQQRLTTCLLLLDRVRRALKAYVDTDEGADDAVRDIRKLLTVQIGGVRTRRLQLAGDLGSFWDNIILGEDPMDGVSLSEGQRRLDRARRFFDTRIADLTIDVDDSVKVKRLIDLRTRVNSRLRFLVYEVRSNAEVGVLFETLNERGQPLSELEKVKNYLLYLARQISPQQSDDLAKKINQAWSVIFGNLAGLPVDDDALLNAHWLATKDHRPNEWKRTASIKARFPRHKYVPSADRLTSTGAQSSEADYGKAWQELYDDVSDYVRSLQLCSAFLRDMHTDGAKYHDFTEHDAARARRANAALVRGDVWFPFRPLMFAARLRYPQDGAFYAELVELCETYSARLFAICQFRTNAGRTTLAKAAFDLHSGLDRQEILETIRSCIWNWAPDEAVSSEFVPEKNWYHRRSHKYVLYEYELEINKEIAPFRDFIQTGRRKTTEHVLPQTPEEGSQWLVDFGENHSRLVHGIGNLVLTYDNSSYGRKEYSQKRGSLGTAEPCYLGTSALNRARELGSLYETWTPATVEQRLQQIRAWALQRWAVVPPNDIDAEELDADSEMDDAADEATVLSGQTA
ncbi:hypothetical protein Kisp01_67470 [Kineosporia sp. NBRC 101677]|uniref:DUF262 domain-containing protein n=1 Tax=Kineosporia sp. NBRC 101677 TaxID=3032197 RepID=UPI0024A1A24A|nr:DUF262 domain-containing protein [Kineosporia sp. NBRC 101677]GLY19733.1 hypothetical protein Kisp01_67470 [Kineosporia sp. NBRC 101677]